MWIVIVWKVGRDTFIHHILGSLKPHDLWDVFIHSDFIYPHVVLCCFVFFLCSFLQNRNYYVKIISPHRLFQLEPAAKSIFGFSEDENIFACEKKLDRFAYHAQHFIQMLDKALHLLGPDIEMLTDIFMEIGAKHVQYGTSCHVTSCHVTSRHVTIVVVEDWSVGMGGELGLWYATYLWISLWVGTILFFFLPLSLSHTCFVLIPTTIPSWTYEFE